MDYNKRYDEWMSHLSEEDPLKEELYKIKDNEKEKEERFYQDLSFGTAGLRGKVGAGTNMMNFLTVGKASQGIADYIIKCGKEAMDKGVVIARSETFFKRVFTSCCGNLCGKRNKSIYIPRSQTYT